MEKMIGEKTGPTGDAGKGKSGKPGSVSIRHEFGPGAVEFKTAEHDDDRQARIRREEADADHQRRKDFALFVAVVVMVCIVATACLWITLNTHYSADSQKWATSLLTVIVSASLGYMTGKTGREK